MQGTKDLFQPIEDILREKFIPAIIGRKVSDIERKILALPVRFGGIGLLNPVETADTEYRITPHIIAPYFILHAIMSGYSYMQLYLDIFLKIQI